MDLEAENYVVSARWLLGHLDAPDLRIIECTSLLPNYFEESCEDGLELESGRSDYDAGHIPASGFADILRELSNPHDETKMYGMPAPEQFAEVMGRLGIGEGTAVVLYDRQLNMWASRVWWLLRAHGFKNAAVLDGGWAAWCEAGGQSSTGACNYLPCDFKVNESLDLIASKEEVLAATQDRSVCLINALDEDEFSGRPPHRYARPGRIPSSINVPFARTADPETNRFVDETTMRTIFEAAGDALSSERVICYCGGGIAACNTALALTRLGVENVAVYDGSMTEWTLDPATPLETG
ncbi:MAG: sulfurtransferase [Pseudomonadota bacterium]